MINFYLSYAQDCVDKLNSTKEIIEKLNVYINNQILQNAAHNVSFDWFNNNELYNAVKNKDVNKIIEIKSKGKMKRKIKKLILEVISKII